MDGYFTASPAATLDAVFAHIAATRMRDLPLANPALAVETVGFRRWDPATGRLADDGRLWLGILITPWCMNLMLLPAEADALPAVPAGGETLLTLPGGTLPFMAGSEEGIGAYRMCSLFSPMELFADREGARATAQAVLDELFPAAEPQAPDLSRRRLFGLAP